MKDKGYRIALIGLDGSGKSANIDRMKKDPDYRLFDFLWVRWKPTLLKPAYLIMQGKVNKSKEIASARSENQKRSEEQQKLNADYNKKSSLKSKVFKNPVVRRLWIFAATFDYFFQFYFKTVKYLIKRKNIIFDRFYLDLYVDQGINFNYSPAQIEKEISRHKKLFPSIDKVVYIRVSPETCYKRKDDIPNMDYLEKRFEIYEHLARKHKWKAVDGEQPFDTVYSDIKKIILK